MIKRLLIVTFSVISHYNIASSWFSFARFAIYLFLSLIFLIYKINLSKFTHTHTHIVMYVCEYVCMGFTFDNLDHDFFMVVAYVFKIIFSLKLFTILIPYGYNLLRGWTQAHVPYSINGYQNIIFFDIQETFSSSMNKLVTIVTRST